MTFYVPIKPKKRGPQKVIRKRTYNRITMVFAADSKMPTIRGKWERLSDGRIRAWYTPDEYEYCLDLFEVTKDARGGDQ